MTVSKFHEITQGPNMSGDYQKIALQGMNIPTTTKSKEIRVENSEGTRVKKLVNTMTSPTNLISSFNRKSMLI